MSTPQLTEEDRALREIIAPVEQRFNELEARKTELQAELATTDASAKKLKAILKVADPDRFVALPLRRTSRRNGVVMLGGRVSVKRVKEALEAIKTMEQPFTRSALATKTGWSKSSTDNAIAALKEEGMIRLIGQGKEGKQFQITPKGLEGFSDGEETA
jgi:predicted transcriptional regulator